ncbi:MAG: Rne/Rng family ribonuclease [Tepidisphaeraceae bacterium]
MAKEMLINVSAGEECRIALLEDGKLDELYMERTSNTSHVGNIYKGKVTNVEPSIQAAFVDFGIGRNGFLHISDLMPTYFGGKKGDKNAPAEKVGQKLGRRDRPPIQQCLRKGDEIIVQIIKEGIGTKGPTLSTYLSIPGRVLVMMPGMAKMGVSKKIEDEEERTRLRKILDGLTPPKDCGFIIRTAGIGKTKLEIEKDLKYLARLWEQLKKSIDKEKPPFELYTEGDLVTRTVRDVFTTDVDKIIVDDKATSKKVKDFIKLAMPRTKNKVDLYEEVVPLFHKYELEQVIEGIHSRRVPLPSGGYLIIDQTEAVVAIDVNSGKFREHSDAETTAFKTDMEAADEIARQLRLRDMGGVIICDFIDLRFERHRRELEERLFENLKKDRAKTRMLRMSQFGIVEMTRQRMRPSLKKAVYHECEACQGQGLVKTPESLALDVMRKLRLALNDTAVATATLTVHPDVAIFLQNKKRYEIAKLEQVTEKRVTILADAELATDETKFELYDSRDGYVYIADLGMALPSQHHQRGQNQPQGGGRRDRRDDRRRDQQAKAKHDRRDDSVDSEELFTEEGGETKPDAKPQGKGAKSKPQAEGDDIEQTGNDDEAAVVEVDEGGDSGPGHAPGGFYERGEENRRDRGRDRRGRDRRGGRNRNDRDHRGGDRNNDRQDRGPRDQRNGRAIEAAEPVEAAEGEELDETPLDAEAEGGSIDEAGEQTGEFAERGEGQPNGDGQPGEGGRRRRRRRRGRRGRGRGNGEGQPNAEGGNAAEGNPNPNGQQRQPQGNQNHNNNRRGSHRVDLSHLAREAAQRDAEHHDGENEDDDSSIGNDINYVPKPKEEPAGRGRRGGRQRGGRQRGGKQAVKKSPPIEGLPDDDELEREAAELEARLAAEKAAESKPAARSKRPPQPIEVPDVAPTGSSDSHLADDDPADGEEIRPISSYSDLDALPDYDDD